jgi:hypothetical protein
LVQNKAAASINAPGRDRGAQVCTERNLPSGENKLCRQRQQQLTLVEPKQRRGFKADGHHPPAFFNPGFSHAEFLSERSAESTGSGITKMVSGSQIPRRIASADRNGNDVIDLPTECRQLAVLVPADQAAIAIKFQNRIPEKRRHIIPGHFYPLVSRQLSAARREFFKRHHVHSLFSVREHIMNSKLLTER